jgi:hypothetical protein
MYSLSPAGPIADLIPQLMHLPEWILHSKWMERFRRAAESKVFTTMLSRVERQSGVTTSLTSYARTLLEKKCFFKDEYEASYMVGMMVNVAIITIGSSLRTFILE